MFLPAILCSARSFGPSGRATGANWTGNMHPEIPLGSNPLCNRSTLVGCAPTYDRLDQAGVLWDCPAGGKDTAGSCGAAGCVESNQTGSGNPHCTGQLDDANSCCCPLDGCYAAPLFNQVCPTGFSDCAPPTESESACGWSPLAGLPSEV